MPGQLTDASSELVEIVKWEGQTLAYIIRPNPLPTQTAFFTPPELKQQVGFVAYPAGDSIPRHAHVPLERRLVGTSEVLVVYRGACVIDVYNDDRELVDSKELGLGDIVLLVGGGHGFRMLEDTVLLEVKQGPYTGLVEKERF